MNFILVFLLSLLLNLTSPSKIDKNYNIRPYCNYPNHYWIPIVTKHPPYMTFLNDDICPSWQTRDSFTKTRRQTHLQLPAGVPFSFYCSACYWPTKRNFSIEVTSTAKYFQKQIPKSSGEMKYDERLQECVIKYGIIYPTEYGEIICSSTIVNTTKTEKVTFSVYDVPNLTKTLHIDMPEDENSVSLSCPGHPVEDSRENPLTHVWYNTNSPKFIFNTTKPRINVILKSDTLEVSCSTYSILYLEEVSTVSFIIGRNLPTHQTLNLNAYEGTVQSKDTSSHVMELASSKSCKCSYDIYATVWLLFFILYNFEN